jgi:hypothetical protein
VTVFVLTEGMYSSTQIVAVFDSLEAAKEAVPGAQWQTEYRGYPCSPFWDIEDDDRYEHWRIEEHKFFDNGPAAEQLIRDAV